MVSILNSKQLQYAIALSKTCNFSQVSEQLNISQPSLSKQIMNLENELGIKLFDRNTVPITVTQAGEYFFREAKQLLYQEDQLLRSLEQFKSGEKGRLTIGISPFRNLYLMPRIIRKIKEKYPGVQVVLHESPSDQLRKEAAEGKYDFVIVNLPVDEAVLDIRPLEKEHLVLAVPNDMVDKIINKGNSRRREIDFSSCKDLPFVVVAQPQEMRRYFDKLCAMCNVVPEISVEVAGGVTTAWSMARAGIGATLLPLQFVADQKFDENLTIFTISNSSHTRQPVIATRSGQYLSEYAEYAIDLLMHSQSLFEE
jgi:DNA-binding transcriptional LysR family regulator